MRRRHVTTLIIGAAVVAVANQRHWSTTRSTLNWRTSNIVVTGICIIGILQPIVLIGASSWYIYSGGDGTVRVNGGAGSGHAVGSGGGRHIFRRLLQQCFFALQLSNAPLQLGQFGRLIR